MKLPIIILACVCTVLVGIAILAAFHTHIDNFAWSATISFGTSPEQQLADVALPRVAMKAPMPQHKPVQQ